MNAKRGAALKPPELRRDAGYVGRLLGLAMPHAVAFGAFSLHGRAAWTSRYDWHMSRAPSHDVVPLDRTDSGRAGEVMGRAFYDADQWASLLPDPNVRQKKLEQMFTGTVKLTYAAGGLVETTPGFEAVAMWLPPGRSIGLWSVMKSGFASARFVVTPPFPNLRRLTATMRQFDQSHRQQMTEPHWYLMALGVDPASQGSGYGTALVREGIERANQDGRPIYLETETAANASFYERLGFETLDEITIEAIGMPFSLMIRRPDPADASTGA